MAYEDLGYTAITDSRIRYGLSRPRVVIEIDFYLRWIPDMETKSILFFAVQKALTPGSEEGYELILRPDGGVTDKGIWSIGYWEEDEAT